VTSYLGRRLIDSGVPWLREIPETWRVVNGRRLFANRNARAHSEDEELTASQKHGVIPKKMFVELEGRRVVEVIKDAAILKHVEKGDFVISMRSFQGGLEYSGYSGCVSSAYVPLVPTSLNDAGYFRHLFKSADYIQALQSTSNLIRDGQALRFENFSQVPIPLPPVVEQKAIAAFLDRETAQIDNLIDKQELLITTLVERRQGMIDRIVSSSNATSPISETRIRHVATLNPSPDHLIRDEDRDATFLPMNAIGDDGTLNLEAKRPISEVLGSYSFVCDGDVMMAKVTPCFENGKGAVAKNLENGIGFATTEVTVLRPSRSITSEYLHFVLRTSTFRHHGIASMTGAGGLKRVSEHAVKDFKFALPSLTEQRRIATELFSELSKIDALSSKAANVVDRLKERRQALIAAAVTGKIDVRGSTS